MRQRFEAGTTANFEYTAPPDLPPPTLAVAGPGGEVGVTTVQNGAHCSACCQLPDTEGTYEGQWRSGGTVFRRFLFEVQRTKGETS